MSKLVLLDGHAIIHRAYHAIRPLTTPAGELVNAVFGFGSMLLNVLEIEQPEYLAVAFDRKGPTFRHLTDTTYKATRAKSPDELIRQIGRIYEIVHAFNIPEFGVTGFEADDILATIVDQTRDESGLRTIIVSGDRDLLQLVGEKVSVHDLSGGYRESVNFTPAAVEKKFGFSPKLIPDYKALVGDTSDNLAGVNGIGPKTATELLIQFGSLEKIYENLSAIKDSVRERLVRDREQACHTKKMATLRTDAPIEWGLSACRLHDFERQKVLALFDELAFRSLKTRFEKIFPKATIVSPPSVEQQSLF